MKNAMKSNKFEETASLQSGRVLSMTKKNSTNTNGLTNYVITNHGPQSRVVQARRVVIDSRMKSGACQTYSLFIIIIIRLSMCHLALTCSDLFGLVRTCSNLLGLIRICSNCLTIRDSYLLHRSSLTARDWSGTGHMELHRVCPLGLLDPPRTQPVYKSRLSVCA